MISTVSIMLIGRQKEQQRLIEAFESEYSEFVAVYGRRRVGKTFLIRETFGYKFTFQHSGLAKSTRTKQLKAWRDSLNEHGLQIKRFPADWNQFGRSAGIRRNVDMAQNADALIAFWNGYSHGTKHMIKTAIQRKINVKVVRY